MLRRRHVNVKTVKELDAFPKVPEVYVDKTAVGGTCELIIITKFLMRVIYILMYCLILICCLIYIYLYIFIDTSACVTIIVKYGP